MEHANLIKAIGPKPENLPDPKRQEKTNYYIVVNNNDNKQVKVDLNVLAKMDPSALRELNKAIYGGGEITEEDAEILMES